MFKVFLVRRKSDGLFATQSWGTNFRKKGKMWKQPGAAQRKIDFLRSVAISEEYEIVEVVIGGETSSVQGSAPQAGEA